MSKFKVTSDEGAVFIARISGVTPEVGETVDLKLEDGQLAAVIAAGWIEHVTPAKPKEKE